MSPERLDELRRRLGGIDADLDRWERAGEEDPARVELRERIVRLFRDTEGPAAGLVALRAALRSRVERYRGLRDRTAPSSCGPAGGARVDHLGSSTFMEKGWTEIAGGRYGEAAELLDRALALSPRDIEALTLSAWARSMRGELEAAAGTLRRVLARDPRHPLARVILANICRCRKSYGEAIEGLSGVIREQADRRAVLYATFFLGLVYLDRGMYGDARILLARAVELGPNLAEGWWELGRAACLAGEGGAAEEAWREGASRARYSRWGERCERALALLEAGRDPLGDPVPS